jgi:hypothetical protein
MVFDVRRFFIILVCAGLASFLTFLVVQFLMGNVDTLLRTTGKAFLVGLGIALMFSLTKRRSDYPWM